MTITSVWLIILITIACVSDFASITLSGHGKWQEGWAWISIFLFINCILYINNINNNLK